MSRICVWLLMVSSLGHLCVSETVKDREGAVRKDRATFQSETRWIYNDFRRGFSEARRTGKPLLIVLRCVPCLSCAGIDAAVSLEQTELSPLLNQFVCVRVINANALDLSLFQFDYDLSFSTLFFNGDGTLYGRYGSWRHQKDPQDHSTAGLQRTLQAVLALHQDYPTNKQSLAGKQGRPVDFKTPTDIPALGSKYKSELDWKGKVVGSCIHCHQIGEALTTESRMKSGLLLPQTIYPWPAAETIGLNLTADDAVKIQSVTSPSIAASAGLQSGDELLFLAGQPLVSLADVSWVLHHAPDQGKLIAGIKRNGGHREIGLELPAGWRAKADISRRVSTWNLRAIATGGLVLEDLADADRKARGLQPNEMGLLVKWVGEYGKHAAGKRAGFRKDDVLIELDSRRDRIAESELLGLLLQTHKAGDVVKATVLRGQERIDLVLPIQ